MLSNASVSTATLEKLLECTASNKLFGEGQGAPLNVSILKAAHMAPGTEQALKLSTCEAEPVISSSKSRLVPRAKHHRNPEREQEGARKETSSNCSPTAAHTTWEHTTCLGQQERRNLG